MYKSAVTDRADRRRNATHSKTPENWFTHLKGHSQKKQEVVPEAQTDESTLLECSMSYVPIIPNVLIMLVCKLVKCPCKPPKPTHTLSRTHIRSLSHTHTHTHTHTRREADTHMHTSKHTRTQTHTFALTHTHMLFFMIYRDSP